jgi:hypothetical protein
VVVGEPTGRPWGGLFGRIGARRGPDAGAPQEIPEPAASGSVYATKALRKFLATLTSRPNPVLLDLGPVIGANVSYFGEQLGCKIFVEDLYADVERHERSGKLGELAAALAKRLPQGDSTIDGILCWDLLDFLDPASAHALAAQLSRLLTPDGALLGFFSTATSRDATFVKYVVVDDSNLRHRPYGPMRMRSRVLQNRDIIRLFERLRVTDSFLLQTNIREILFRKPAYLTPAKSGA